MTNVTKYDSISLKEDTLQLKLFVISGKEEDTYVMFSPSVMVSGYGNTETEAEQSFDHNLHLFCTDFLQLPQEEKEIHLKKLGFSNEIVSKENFSKLYVDEKGILQGLDKNSIKTSVLKKSERVG